MSSILPMPVTTTFRPGWAAANAASENSRSNAATAPAAFFSSRPAFITSANGSRPGSIPGQVKGSGAARSFSGAYSSWISAEVPVRASNTSGK